VLRADIDDILNSIHESWAEHPSNKRKHDGRRIITQLKNAPSSIFILIMANNS